MPRYSQKRPPGGHTSSIQFDAGVSDRKPTAAKSAGTLGKWGVTSFTSIRSSIVNGSHDSSAGGRVASPPVPPADPFSFESNTPAPARKVKKFFKSRNAPAVAGAADSRRQPPPPPAAPPDGLQNVPSPADEKPEEPESKRFFSSPALPQPLRDTTTTRANSLSPREPPAAPQAPRMPPLKLRISRDKDTGDLTAVSGPPAEGGGGGRRRRQPAAPAAPQPPKAPRYKSPPPAPAPPASPPPADAGGGVRRTRRAAALQARQRVARTVQYGDQEDYDVPEELVPQQRGRRPRGRKGSASEVTAAREEKETVANGGAMANDSPAGGVMEDDSPVGGGMEAGSPAGVAMADDSPAGVAMADDSPGGAEEGAEAADSEAGTEEEAEETPAGAPVETEAQGVSETAAEGAAEQETPPEANPAGEPETAAPPPAPPAQQPAAQPAAQPPPQPAGQPEPPDPPSERRPAADPEPVNLSTRRPAADLERQLSSLFGEPPPAAPAPAAETERASRVYRKGIKDLGRYQRTQASQPEPEPDPEPGAAGSPRRYQELETQLALLEAPDAAPDGAPGGAPGTDPGAVPGSAPGVPPDTEAAPGASSEEAEPPALTRADTEPAVGRSTRSAAAGAKAAHETKKGSIFKTRSGQGRAARARYNHRWTDDKEEPPTAAAAAPAQNSDAAAALSALDFSESPPAPGAGGSSGTGAVSGKLTRVSTWPGSDPDASQQPVTSVRVDRRAKEYYTVIQNVKKAYQIQEFGEFQEYNDDIDYIMDALQPTNSVSTRCLSATRLAGKCMAPAFRMHLRAHGTVTRFFAALSDALSDPSLALCTSAVMFILSEDQLNMDLDKSSLELMLSLLDSDVTSPAADAEDSELRKNRAKVRELCAELQRRGQARQLCLDSITAGHLAMETLLSLTSQRAGAWFKEELRQLGGLDRLLGTVSDSLHSLRQPRPLRQQSGTIARITRCLRLVENVTSRNEENQRYLLQAAGGEALGTLSGLFQLAEAELADCTPAEFQPAESAARTLLDMTDTLMKVLVNLSAAGLSPLPRPLPSAHPSPRAPGGGGALLGSQPGLLSSLLHAVLRLPESLPEQRQFDVLLLAMYLLMNLAEGGAENRRRIVAAPAPPRAAHVAEVPSPGTAVPELLQMFYRLVRLASEVETHTDRILDGSAAAAAAAAAPAPAGGPQQDAGEVTATALIQKAGHHMEKTVIAAYIGVLAGHLAMDNMGYEAAVRSHLSGGRFTDVIDVLRKLLSFMDLTNTGRPETVHEMRTMKRVIDFMTRADQGGPPAAPAPATPSCEDLGVLDMSL